MTPRKLCSKLQLPFSMGVALVLTLASGGVVVKRQDTEQEALMSEQFCTQTPSAGQLYLRQSVETDRGSETRRRCLQRPLLVKL